MIVRMRRLRVIALSRAERGLIRDLGRLGCVEIESSLNDPDGTGVAGLLKPFGVKGDSEKKYNAVSSALRSLSRYSPSKPKFLTPRCRVKEAEFENETNTARALELASRINGITEKFSGLSADERRLESRKAAIMPWKTLDIPLDYAGGRRFAVLLGTCPSVYRVKDIEQELSSAAPESELTLVFSDKEQHYFSLVCHKGVFEKASDALRKFGFSKTDPGVSGKTALEALSGLDSELQGIKGERAALEREIASLSSSRPLLEQAVDFLSFDVLRDETLNKLGSTKETVYMECWLPAETEAPVKKILEESDCAYMFSDPSDAEEPPVALKNSPAVSPFSTITEMYGLPNYTSVVDPNPFVAFFYFLFFGMMLSDAAYGLCMVVFGLIVLKKARPSGMVKNIMQLSVALGVSTFFWGAVFGSWFGDCIPVVSKMLTGKEFNLPFVIEPMSNPIAVLILALGLGVLHIFVGMGLSAYRMIKQGHIKDAFFDVGFWYLIIGGLISALVLGKSGLYIAAAGAAGVLFTAGRAKKSVFGKITGGLGALYGVTGYLSDVLSYSRLMALGLTTGVVATVVNAMGSLGGNTFLGWLLFLFAFLLGHSFNIAVNILGSFVHSCRLHYVEFFGKFFEGGGHPFTPLSIKTKYVEIIKEDN